MSLDWTLPVADQRRIAMRVKYLVRGEISSQKSPPSVELTLQESEQTLKGWAWAAVGGNSGVLAAPNGRSLHWVQGNCMKDWKWYETSLRPWRNPARHFTYRVNVMPRPAVVWPTLSVTIVPSKKDRLLGVAATASGGAGLVAAVAGAVANPIGAVIATAAGIMLATARRQFANKKRLESQMTTPSDSATFFDFHSEQLVQPDESVDLADDLPSQPPEDLAEGLNLGEIRTFMAEAMGEIEASGERARNAAIGWQSDGIPQDVLRLWTQAELPTLELKRSIESGEAHVLIGEVGDLAYAVDLELERSIGRTIHNDDFSTPSDGIR